MIGFGMPGMTEWIVILVIVLIFFGPGRLPEVFKRAGEGVRAFKDASDGKGEKKPEAEEEEEEEVVVRRKKSPKQLTSEDELDEAEEKESVGASKRKG